MRGTVLSKIMAVSFLAVISMVGVGCKTDCDEAADQIAAKYDSCGIESEGSGEEGEGEEAECTEADGILALCVADCTEAASCELLKGEGTTEEATTYAE